MPDVDSGSAVEIPDEELVRRAQRGDPDGSSQIVERYSPLLVRFCYRYLGRFDEAEDAVQDVLSTIVAGHWPEGTLRSWVFRLARNRCIDLLRARNDGQVMGLSVRGDSKLPSPHTGPRTAVLREDRHQDLRRHLESLVPEHREVLVLRYFESLARREIAEVLELSDSVVKSRLFEARRQLQRMISETKN